MTSDRQLERLLDSWLEEGPTVVADRVVDDAASRISRQHQRSAWRLRTSGGPTVSVPGHVALAAALVALMLLAGGLLLAGRQNANPPPAIPTSVGPVAPPVMAIPDGPIAGGTYGVRPRSATDASFVIDVPAGGWSSSSGRVLQGPGGPQAPGGTALAFYLDPRLHGDDPCSLIADDLNRGDDLVAEFAQVPGTTMSNLTDLRIDGRAAKRLDLDFGSLSLRCSYFRPVEDSPAIQEAPAQWRVWLVDVDGTTAMMVRFAHPGTSATDLAAADAIAESARIVQPRQMENGPIAPGLYAGVGDPAWSFTVPAGWSSVRDWELYPTDLGPAGTTAAGEPNGLALAYFRGTGLVVDACDGQFLSRSTSVGDFVAAIQANRDWLVTEPVDAMVGGYAGKRVDAVLPDDLLCPGPYYVFRDPTGPADENTFWAQGPANRLRIWVIDVDGQAVLLVRSSFAATPPEALAEADDIVDSIVFTP